jgi:tetratricopeptide (TPR) repeat protein
MKNAMRIAVVAVLMVALLPLHAEAQKPRKKKKKKDNTADVVALYDKGSYQEAADAVGQLRSAGDADPAELFAGGLALEGLQQKPEAASTYAEIAASRPDTDAWHWIGESARALASGDVNTAVTASNRAVEIDAGNKYGYFQRGLVLSNQRSYQPAAEAFTRVLEIDGSFAYGHYYAALAFYQVRSLVAATNHFERFLELAPEAPERVQVEGILAALRGS